jgi:hypothetical protein
MCYCVIYTIMEGQKANEGSTAQLKPMKMTVQQIYDDRFLHVNIVGYGAYG